jgi:hypothetical protein
MPRMPVWTDLARALTARPAPAGRGAAPFWPTRTEPKQANPI